MKHNLQELLGKSRIRPSLAVLAAAVLAVVILTLYVAQSGGQPGLATNITNETPGSTNTPETPVDTNTPETPVKSCLTPNKVFNGDVCGTATPAPPTPTVTTTPLPPEKTNYRAGWVTMQSGQSVIHVDFGGQWLGDTTGGYAVSVNVADNSGPDYGDTTACDYFNVEDKTDKGFDIEHTLCFSGNEASLDSDTNLDWIAIEYNPPKQEQVSKCTSAC